MIIQNLTLQEVLAASSACSSWYLPPDRVELWRALAQKLRIELPGPLARPTRLAGNLKRALLLGVERKRSADQQLKERECWKIWLQLHKGEACGALRRASKRLARHAVEFDPDVRITFYGNRTVAMLAAWRGRLRTVRLLLEDWGSDPNAADDNGFTPLLMAAWAGHLEVVNYLIGSTLWQVDFMARGIPPMSSSCGGKGPFTAFTWAERKGFHEVASTIRWAMDNTVEAQHEHS